MLLPFFLLTKFVEIYTHDICYNTHNNKQLKWWKTHWFYGNYGNFGFYLPKNVGDFTPILVCPYKSRSRKLTIIFWTCSYLCFF